MFYLFCLHICSKFENNIKLLLMKKFIYPLILMLAVGISSCSKKDCKDCTGCATKADAELCEEDFETSSDFSDQIDNYVSDGCTCADQ